MSAEEKEQETETKPTESKPAESKPKESKTPKEPTQPWWQRNVDHLIGGGIGLLYVVWLLATARSLGFSRDEGFYFSASSQYEQWFKMLFAQPGRALERPMIDGAWSSNHEHPSLMKSLFALSDMFFHQKWELFSDQSTAFRFPAMCMMGMALWITYLFAAKTYSRRAGIVAAAALGLMPNVFYHAHLACFDVPIMAMWIACVFAYWNAEKKGGLGMALLAGVVYGLTLETKHNAWMLPAVFLPHALVVHGRAIGRHAAKTARIPVPASLIAMATVGPAVFVLLWPWMWNDTMPRIQEYVNFHVHHEYYNIEFLGVTYWGPPSPKSYMPVMILATVPTSTIVLFVVGAIDRLKGLLAQLSWFFRSGSEWFASRVPWPKTKPEVDRVQTDLLLFLSIAVPLAVFLLPRTPIFGGTKHWITAYPGLCIFAGRGFDLAAAQIEKRWKQPWAIPLAGALALSGAAAVTAHSHPFGLSAYVPFFGGTAGGADLGLNRQFWGFTTQSLDDYFKKNAKPGDRVYIMDTAWPSWQRMIDEKRIPPFLQGVGSPAEADFSIVHHEQHINEVDYNIWTEYHSVAPDFVLTHDGVPIISVYRRPQSMRRGAGGRQH